jgi:hypothetical protein
MYRAWSPDGIFSNQKSQFGLILVRLAMENTGIFYGHLVYFMGKLCGMYLVYLPRFGIL